MPIPAHLRKQVVCVLPLILWLAPNATAQTVDGGWFEIGGGGSFVLHDPLVSTGTAGVNLYTRFGVLFSDIRLGGEITAGVQPGDFLFGYLTAMPVVMVKASRTVYLRAGIGYTTTIRDDFQEQGLAWSVGATVGVGALSLGFGILTHMVECRVCQFSERNDVPIMFLTTIGFGYEGRRQR